MAQNDLLKRYLEAGMQFTQVSQQRAEAWVRDMVKAGEVQAEQAQQVVQDLVERSRQNTERLVELVRKEVRNQLAALEGVSKDALARVEQQMGDMRDQLAGLSRRGGAKKASQAKTQPVKKAAAKKAPAKKAPAKKAAPRKSGA